jgi:signal transduction histidine kinase
VREVRTGDEMRAALLTAGEETDRLVQLAEDLLVIARADRGVPPVRRADVSAQALLASVARRFETPASRRGATVEVRAPGDCTVPGDVAQLERALANLVDNALRHGGTRIELAAEGRDGLVELHVRDDGEGFPPAFIATAFERFSRADASRARGGTGLGLALVEAVARAHGGGAAASNMSEGGADVWLSLPGSSRCAS